MTSKTLPTLLGFPADIEHTWRVLAALQGAENSVTVRVRSTPPGLQAQAWIICSLGWGAGQFTRPRLGSQT